MTGYRTPWDSPLARVTPALLPDGAKPQTKPRGRRPQAVRQAVAGAGASPGWLYHHLTVSGPAEPLASFVAAARGSGVVPWQHDALSIEEDVFNLAVAVPPARRNLNVEGCRILARQFRTRVEAHQARASALVGASRACPFDLHALVPAPPAILRRGPCDPQALAAWLGSRPQLGHEVFARGRPEPLGLLTETRHQVDVIEFLWASLALFDEEGAGVDTASRYQPRRWDLHPVPDARDRILRLLGEGPDGRSLDQLLPEQGADVEDRAETKLKRCSAWTSTFVACLELAKQGEVGLEQDQGFTPIRVRQEHSVPSLHDKRT